MRHMNRSKVRTGAAAVEFAVSAPILFMFFFGLWEYSRCEMIRQTAAIAAFEAARMGTVSGATSSEMKSTAENVLARAKLNDVHIAVSPSAFNSTASVTVPLDKNSGVTPFFFKGKTINSSFTLSKK